MCVVGVYDNNDSVDNIIHNQIKYLVRQSIVMEFRLVFCDGNINDNDDGL